MQTPTLIVEAAFGYGPLATPTWTDITAYVQSGSTKVGRQHELQRFETGTGQLVLDNRDGRFYVWNTSSPYTGKLVARTPVRIRATWSGTTYGVFYGFADAWTPADDVISSQVTLTFSDLFKILARKNISGSLYRSAVLADSPSLYWRLADAAGSATAADSSGNSRSGTCNGGTNGPVLFGQPSALIAENDFSADLSASPSGAAVANSRITPPASPYGASPAGYTAECWLKMPSGGANTCMPFTGGTNLSDTISFSGTASNVALKRSGTVILTVNGVQVFDQQWHHVAITCPTGTGTLTIYVDGVSVGTVSTTWPFAAPVVGGYSASGEMAGQMDEVALYPAVLSAARVAAHYAAGRYFRDTETSGVRLGKVLDVLGIPAGMRSIAAGAITVQPEPSTLTATKALDYLYQLVDTEDGGLYVDPSGVLTFAAQGYATGSVSQGTFTDDTSSTLHYEPGIGVLADDLDIYNEVQVSVRNGITVDVFDQTSQDAYGATTLTRPGLWNSVSDASALAATLLARFKNPVTRIPALTLASTANGGANLPHMLGRHLLDRITVKRKPGVGGSQLVQDSIIEAASHTFAPGLWSTGWALSPYELL